MTMFTDTPRVFVFPDGRLDRKNTATYLGCSPKTLADWAMKGYGPPYIISGGRAFYFLDDLKDWINASPRHAGSAGRKTVRNR